MARSLRRTAPAFTFSWTLAITAGCYGLLMGAVGSRLTFYAEDYDAILNQSEAGLSVILQGTYGHWAPLSRLFFLGETYVFGNWYAGYVAVNGVLLVTGLWLYATPIARSLNLAHWWVRLAFMQIALVPGVMSVVLLASNIGWFLPIFLASLSGMAASRNMWRTATGLAAVACLSSSALGVFWVLVAVGVSGILVVAREPEKFQLWRRFAAMSVGLAIGIFFVGRFAARIWTSPYFAAYQTESGSSLTLSGIDLGEVLWSGLLLLAAWSLLSTWPAAMALISDAVPRLVFLLIDYWVLAFGILLTILILALAVVRLVRSGKVLLILAVVLAPTLLSAFGTALFRDNQLADRYVLMWLPPLVVLAWTAAIAVSWHTLTRKARLGVRVLTVLGLTSAVVLVLSLPVSVRMAADIDRPRWDFSQDQMALAHSCLGGDDVMGLEEVSPVPTDDYLCELTVYLNSVGLFE